MTDLLICSVTVLMCVACQISYSRTQTISANPDGTWTTGSTVILTCTISSYSGEMKWKFGSTDVAKCSVITCSTLETGKGSYLFGFDTTNRVFTWTLKPVNIHTGDVFYCSNGTNTANFTATVEEPKTEHTIEYKLSVYSTVGSTIAILGVIALIIGVVYIHKRQEQQSRTLSWLLDQIEKLNNRMGKQESKLTIPYQDDRKVQALAEDSTTASVIRVHRPLPEIKKNNQ